MPLWAMIDVLSAKNNRESKLTNAKVIIIIIHCVQSRCWLISNSRNLSISYLWKKTKRALESLSNSWRLRRRTRAKNRFTWLCLPQKWTVGLTITKIWKRTILPKLKRRNVGIEKRLATNWRSKFFVILHIFLSVFSRENFCSFICSFDCQQWKGNTICCTIFSDDLRDIPV